jgi:hypothetical protein
LGLWLGRLLLVMGRVRVLLTGLPSGSVRHAQVVRAGFDQARCGNDVLFAELRRWGAGHACARPPVGRQIYREILASEKLVCVPGNGALAFEEWVWRARPAVAKVRVLTS